VKLKNTSYKKNLCVLRVQITKSQKHKQTHKYKTMKQLITTAVLLFSMTAFAQVGINNTSPKATLDITAKTNGTKPEGLIIPQLTGSDIRIATAASVYGTAQKGLIVYASAADSAPAGATANITTAGYYYFDGTNWQKISTGNTVSTTLNSGNIYVGNASNVATAVSPTGDITISNTGVTSIGAGKVTNGHLASAAALTVKGNATNAAASPTDIAAGTDGYVLRRSGTTLGFGTVATAGIADGAVTTNKIATDAVTSAQIATGAVTNTDLASAAALTVKGNATNAAASPTDIAAGTDGYVLRRSGTTLGFGTVDTAGITDGAVTTAKIATGAVSNADLASAAALTVKGNATNAAASPTDIAAGTDGYVLRRSGTTLGFGTVATAGIADGAITTNKIATDAITSTQIATGAVSNADLATAAALTVKGNATNAAASPTDIAAGTDGYVLRRSGTSLGFGTVATAGIADGAVTTNKIATDAITSTQIATGAVSNADLASAAALTVKGNATNAAASPTDIAAGTDGYVLRRSGTALGFGTVATAGIADGAVTAAKLNQMSATSGQVLGWNGSVWVPMNSDTTNDAWINDTTNGLVKLGTKSDGTARTTGTDFVAKDNGQIGIGTSSPDASAALDVTSTNKGFLPPRVALTSKTDVTTISSPTAGLLVYNTGAGTLKSAGMYYWDGSQWTSLKGDGGTSSATDLNIGETRTAVITVPTSSFAVGSTGINRTWMNGRAVNNTQSVNYKLLSDAAGSTNGFVNFGPNGALRMDFASGGYTGLFYAPKIINTSSSPVFYSLNALSTGDANMTLGSGMWLAAGAICYQIDGNDGFNIVTNSYSEYLNSNILIHNTTDGSVQFYIGTWSMMSANDGLGHNNIYGLFTITRYK
jgi:hypothetical protein